LIKYFIEHRVDVVRRRTDYELRKAREREHILLGFQKALDNLDEVIRLIRAAKSPAKRAIRLIRVYLMARLSSSPKAGAGHHRAAVAAPDRHGAAEDRSTNWPISSGASPSTWRSWAPKKCCAT
jgi:hypothetical protein